MPNLDSAISYVQSSMKLSNPPKIGVILGSGLGAVGEKAVEGGGVAINYSEIPGMPQTAVAGHAGRLIFGAKSLADVVVMQGRVHYYEGHSLNDILFGIQLLQRLGIETLIVTNAAGGIRSDMQPGDLMLINGHWSFLDVVQQSSRRRAVGQRSVWSGNLRQVAKNTPTALRVHGGIYCMMSGPTYETPAEVRMLASLGVDAVGMSTIPEAIYAARQGIEVLGVSCITNIASGLSENTLDHSEVSATASSVEQEFSRWMLSIISKLKNT